MFAGHDRVSLLPGDRADLPAVAIPAKAPRCHHLDFGLDLLVRFKLKGLPQRHSSYGFDSAPTVDYLVFACCREPACCPPALLALASRRPPSGPNWIHEIKHDGYRLMARRDGR